MHLKKHLKAKATLRVASASLEYEGSVTLSEELCKYLGISQWEAVDINNKTNGERITTYVMYGPIMGYDECFINGAAAILFNEGDIVHINCFSYGNGHVREPEIYQL